MSYDKKYCENCLMIERQNDKKRRDEKKKEADKKNTITHKFCGNCNKSFTIDHYNIDRGIKFELSDDLFMKLILQNCHYCGRYYSQINSYGEEYSKMGIDRIDSNGDYTENNVVTACAICNRMKYIRYIPKIFYVPNEHKILFFIFILVDILDNIFLKTYIKNHTFYDMTYTIQRL
jgi:hypothetical protein